MRVVHYMYLTVLLQYNPAVASREAFAANQRELCDLLLIRFLTRPNFYSSVIGTSFYMVAVLFSKQSLQNVYCSK